MNSTEDVLASQGTTNASVSTPSFAKVTTWHRRCIVHARRRVKDAMPMVILLLLVTGLWEGIVRVFHVPAYLLPAPSDIARAMGQSARMIFIEHSPVTLMEAVVGFTAATTVGVTIGTLVHLFPLVRKTIYPLLVVSQTVPTIVLAPLLVLWFGYGLLPKVVLVTIACFFPIAIGTVDGLDSASPAELKLLISFGATPFQQFWKVKIPRALPAFFTGARVSMTYAVMAAVIGEWMGADKGLGVFIVRSAHSFRSGALFAGMIVVMAYSVVCFKLVDVVRRFALPWEKFNGDASRHSSSSR